MWRENRIDFARMFLHQGEPYSLRKFKRIFKREMNYRPHLYDVLNKDGQPKTKIKGININDPRAVIPKVDLSSVKLPKDFAEKLAEYKKLNNLSDRPNDQDGWLKKQGFTDEQISKIKADDEEALKQFQAQADAAGVAEGEADEDNVDEEESDQ